MGGRGTFAAGNPVPYTYEVDSEHYVDGKLDGIKVLKGIAGTGKHGLPESSHSSWAYLNMNPDGTFNTLRVFDKNHALRLEIAYHPENQLAPGKDKVLHYHIYSPEFSTTKNSSFRSTSARLHNKSRIYKRFSNYFKGVKL